MERELGGVVCIMVELKLIVRSFAAACVVCQYSLTNCPCRLLYKLYWNFSRFFVLLFFGHEGWRRDQVTAKGVVGPHRKSSSVRPHPTPPSPTDQFFFNDLGLFSLFMQNIVRVALPGKFSSVQHPPQSNIINDTLLLGYSSKIQGWRLLLECWRLS